MVGSMAGRHGARAVAESLHLDLQPQCRERYWEWGGLSERLTPAPSDTPPPISPLLLIFLKQFHQLGFENSNIQAYGAILTQTVAHVWVGMSLLSPLDS